MPKSAEELEAILSHLGKLYPDPRTELRYESPFQLLVAVLLSAQTTDRQVNLVSPALFEHFPDPATFAAAEPESVEPFIRQIGLFHTKARNVVHLSRELRDRFGGRPPATREELMTLPGVGRKTANVFIANALGIPAFGVDTHVLRVANRLGLVRAKTPLEVEMGLCAIIPERLWNDAHHWLILHGRRVCKAQRPLCPECVLSPWCDAFPVARVPRAAPPTPKGRK